MVVYFKPLARAAPSSLARLRRDRCSAASCLPQRSSHWSNGSRAASVARRRAAADSFWWLVPLASAICSQVAPLRRAASIQKVSAHDVSHWACRRASRASNGFCGPRSVRVSVSAALRANWRPVPPSGVLTGPRVALTDCNRYCRKSNPGMCLLVASTDILRRACNSPGSLPGLLASTSAYSGEKNDPHAVGAAGGHGHHGANP